MKRSIFSKKTIALLAMVSVLIIALQTPAMAWTQRWYRIISRAGILTYGDSTQAKGIVVDEGEDGFVYVAGHEWNAMGGIDNVWQIEKLRKSNGDNWELDPQCWTRTVDAEIEDGLFMPLLSAMVGDDSFLYIAGPLEQDGTDDEWVILKRNKSNGLPALPVGIVTENPDERSKSDIEDDNPGSTGAYTDAPLGMTLSGDGYLYIVGYDQSDRNDTDETLGDLLWRIEKRNKTNLSRAVGDGGWAVTSGDPPAEPFEGLQPMGITADEPGLYIYIAGMDGTWGNLRCRIEKRLKSTGALSGWAINPRIYRPFGDDSSGVLVAMTSDDTYIYTAGWTGGGMDWKWLVEKREKATGNGGPEGAPGCWSMRFDNEDPALPDDRAYAIALDDDFVYVGGRVARVSGMQYKWKVVKRKKDGTGGWDKLNDPEEQDILGKVNAIVLDENSIFLAGLFKYKIAALPLQASRLYAERRDKDIYYDIGLRVWNNGWAVPIAVENPTGITSPLRIRATREFDDPDTGPIESYDLWGVALVDPGNSDDSGVRIETSQGTKALRRYREP